MRLGLLFNDERLELRGDAARMGLPRLHLGVRRIGHVLVVHGARGDAVQHAYMLSDGDNL